MSKRLYVAATNQHVGKTTCTLGIVEAFRQSGIRVGYCKPVGQQAVDLDNLQVDKDALLFSTLMHFNLVARVHSPVILGPGATQAFLDNPSKFPFRRTMAPAIRASAAWPVFPMHKWQKC
jgi:dethiobiotin synthetase